MIEDDFLKNTIKRFEAHRSMCEKALAQVDDDVFFRVPRAESNSIAAIVKHMGGNLVSRWTDFLTSDGEKPDRDRDHEFVVGPDDSRAALMELWNRGWEQLLDTLRALAPADLARTVKIRGEEHSVIDATLRSLGHAAHHIGQIGYLCKLQKDGDWEWITIPPGGSGEFNRRMAEKFDR